MIAAGRCFVQPNFKIQAILRAVLRDEMIAWNKKNNHTSNNTGSSSTGATSNPTGAAANQNDTTATNSDASSVASTSSGISTGAGVATTGQSQSDREIIIQMVTKAEAAITQRLTSLSLFDGTDSKVGTLVAAAHSPDNLCRMDPAWHPWL